MSISHLSPHHSLPFGMCPLPLPSSPTDPAPLPFLALTQTASIVPPKYFTMPIDTFTTQINSGFGRHLGRSVKVRQTSR